MIDRRLLALAGDPDGRRALLMLSERTADVGEVAEGLEVELAEAARILDKMHESGLIEVVGEALNRGTVKPRYRALTRPLWDDENWEVLDRDEQQRMSAWILETIELDAQEGLQSGTIMARPDSHLSRSVPKLDEQGWEEALRIHREALEAIFAVEAASAERLAETGEEGIRVLSALICCEVPSRDGKKRAK